MPVPIPYAPSSLYQPNGRLADLLRSSGQDAARLAELHGQQQGQMWQGIGDSIQRGIATVVQAHHDQPRLDLERAQAAKALKGVQDDAATDAAFAGRGALGPGGTGPVQPPTQQQILDALPGHLKPVVQRQFDEDAIRTTQVQKAQEDLANANAAKLSGLRLAIVQHDYDPAAVRLGVQSALSTYQNDPTMTAQIQRVVGMIGDKPDRATIQRVVDSIPLTKTDQDTLDKHVQTTKKGLSEAALSALDHLADGGTPLSARDVLTNRLASAISDGTIAPGPGNAALMTAAGMNPQQLPQVLSQFVTPEDKASWELKKAETAKNTAEATKAANEQDSVQTHDKLLDGKSATLTFDPKKHQWTDADGTIITNAAQRVKPIPAASLTIHNEQQQGLNLPAWATDDSRPVGTGANTPDATIRMTPNGLHQAALNYIANGQFPPTGRGSDPIAVAQREAINSKVGAIAAAAGMDLPTLRAFYKSNAASLGQQQKMADSVQSFMATADKNAVLLQATLKKLPDIGSPVFNQPLRQFAKNVAGDTNMSQFATYLQSVQNEYARIISQPNLAGQLTDSARQEAEHLIDQKATVPQILASVQALSTEGSNRMIAVGEQINRIQQRMNNAPKDGGGSGSGDMRQRAAQVLQQAGHVNDASAVDTFLKNNPTFK